MSYIGDLKTFQEISPRFRFERDMERLRANDAYAREIERAAYCSYMIVMSNFSSLSPQQCIGEKQTEELEKAGQKEFLKSLISKLSAKLEGL